MVDIRRSVYLVLWAMDCRSVCIISMWLCADSLLIVGLRRGVVYSLGSSCAVLVEFGGKTMIFDLRAFG